MNILLLLASLCRASVIGLVPVDQPLDSDHRRYAADGYQYAQLVKQGGRELWVKNARVIDEAAAGSFLGQSDLSEGGMLVYFKKTNQGFELHYDGKPTKVFYSYATSLTVGPKGHVAFVIAQGDQWIVLAPVGGSRAYTGNPVIIAVSSTGRTLYSVDRTIYADHQPVGSFVDGDKITASGDLARFGSSGVYSRLVTVGGKKYGPYSEASEVAFSADGKSWAFLAVTTKGGSILVQDGKEWPSRPYESTAIVFRPRDNVPHWKAKLGKEVSGLESPAGPGPAFPDSYNRPFIAFSPSGKNWVIPGEGTMLVNGQKRAHGVTIKGPVVFDDENEFHALSHDEKGKLVVLCAAVTKIPVSKSVCVRRASALYARERKGG
jgi:hypothetical protein